MEDLDFLDGQQPEQVDAPVSEPVPEGPARGPDGKFVSPQAPEPGPEPEPQPAASPEPQAYTPPPGYVPVNVVQELRQEIRALKQAPPPPIPDQYEDPEGYQAHREQQINERLLHHTLNTSERFARKEHGGELVDKARDWALQKFQSDPLYYQRVLADPDPYELVVQEFKRDQVFQKLQGSDLDAFLAWKAGQAAPQAAQPAAPAAPPQQPTPPRSMASAPSAGSAKPGEQPVGPGVAFDSVFRN
jgi:hypothetical protein